MRKLITATAVFAGLVGGCNMSCPVQRVQNAPADMLNDTPLIVDQAMQNRSWGRPVAYYANGDVPAGPTGFHYELADGQPEWVQASLDAPLFVGQVIALPLTMWLPPLWTEVRHTGVTMPPTATAMPVLPGTSSSAPAAPSAPTPPDSVPAREPAP